MNKTIETLFSEYLESGLNDIPQEIADTLVKVSAETEAKLDEGQLNYEDLAQHQEVAERAAYYAGFYAALALFKGAGQAQ